MTEVYRAYLRLAVVVVYVIIAILPLIFLARLSLLGDLHFFIDVLTLMYVYAIAMIKLLSIQLTPDIFESLVVLAEHGNRWALLWLKKEYEKMVRMEELEKRVEKLVGGGRE